MPTSVRPPKPPSFPLQLSPDPIVGAVGATGSDAVNQNLWAPWRMSYLRELARQAETLGEVRGEPSTADDGDFLRLVWDAPHDDEANHVVWRDDRGIILLNRYPYANGHLLVALGAAAPCLLDYNAEERTDFWQLVDRAVALCHAALRPQGLNIGVNEGRAAGAGVPTHLHAHIVPRWAGDTNFISVVGDIRVVPDSLDSMAQLYRSVAQSKS